MQAEQDTGSTHRVVHEVLRFVPRVEREHERLEVPPVVERDVGDARAERQVRRDEVERVRRGEVRGLRAAASASALKAPGGRRKRRTPSSAYLVALNLPSVSRAVWSYWEPFWACDTARSARASTRCASTYKDSLTHERELLRVPEVAVVHRAHEDVREHDADVLVELQPERRPQAGAADEVPVEAEREEAHALVIARAAKHVAHDGRVVVREAEDGEPGENGEYPCGSRDGQRQRRGGRRQSRATYIRG